MFLLIWHCRSGWGGCVGLGIATPPMTIVLALFSGKVGLMPRFGARLTDVGLHPDGAGMVMLAYLPTDASYLTEVFPGVLVFSIGLTLLVAPVTTTALATSPVVSSGVGSGVNNAVARIGGSPLQ
jgi:hypothetical protein